MTVGGVLRESWDLYTRFFARFVLMAAMVYVVLNLVGAIAAEAGDDAVAAVFWGLLTLLLSIVGFFWLAGALVKAVDDVRDGRVETTVGELFTEVRPRLPALIAAGLLAGLLIVLGFIALIIPGLYLLTRFSLIAPAVVLEGRRAGESFDRSSELTQGHKWTILWVILIVAIVSAIVRAVLVAVLAFLPDFLQSWIGNTVADAVVNPFAAVAVTVIYFQIRAAREGASVAPVAPS